MSNEYDEKNDTELNELRSTEVIGFNAKLARRITADDFLPPYKHLSEEIVANKKTESSLFSTFGVPAGILLSHKLPSGKSVTLVSEDIRRWTEQDVYNILPTDADLERLPKVKDKEILAIFDALAKASNIVPTPVLVEFVDAPFIGGNGTANVTKEGTKYIQIDISLTRTQQIGVLAHELGHYVNGDHLLSTIALKHNEPLTRLTAELAADAQVVKLCQTKSQIELFQEQMEKHRATAQRYGTTVERIESANRTHPPLEERIKKMTQLQKSYSGECPILLPLSLPDCTTKDDKSCKR